MYALLVMGVLRQFESILSTSNYLEINIYDNYIFCKKKFNFENP
jgi:hypothetical protein